jgi:CRP-like cAMP-binding protein
MLKSGDDRPDGSALQGSLRSRQQTAVTSRAARSIPAEPPYLPTCQGCIVRDAGACPGFGLKGDPESNRKRGLAAIASQVQIFPQRRFILHRRDDTDFVPVICSGWAASSVTMPNGRRQILSFVLSGELASINFLFESCAGRAIEAISQVSCRKFRRSDLHDAVIGNPALLAKLGRALGQERERSDQTALDLGRRSAEARIARLLCHLFDRLRSKGLQQNDTIEFPVRQQQLADATGLTAVHVCKILGRFRANGLLRLDGRRLTILDQKRLREIVEWR